MLPALCELTRRYAVTRWYCGPDEPEHLQALRAALSEARLSCAVVAADDSVRSGIQTITRLLSKRSDGARGLYVSPRCVHTLTEYATYQYPPSDGPGAAAGRRGTLGLAGMAGMEGMGSLAGMAGTDVSELPLKANDHALDATRYALHSALNPARGADAWMRLWLLRSQSPSGSVQ